MSTDTSDHPETEGGRWGRHRALAAVLATGILLFPVACSLLATWEFKRLIHRPSGEFQSALWWIAVLAGSTVIFFATERLARRATPLTVLLKMGLVFPGEAPKRLAIARRAGSVRDLSRRLDEARSLGIAGDPIVAAEKIVTLAVSLGSHDRVTRGHAERVRAITDLIADEMKLSTERRERLRWSALLHDIGKLTVHPDVLNKPGALDDDEWELLRQHPLEGARITAPLAGWLGEWANTIAEHHERFDGKGYPYGLSGHEISLGGRIVAVADTYDVMTSVRSYKKAMSPTVAKAELAACSGGQFDPEIVRHFLAVSLRRIRIAVPFTWLGSLPLGNVGAGLTSVGAVGSNIVATGVLTASLVVGLTVSGASTVAHHVGLTIGSQSRKPINGTRSQTLRSTIAGGDTTNGSGAGNSDSGNNGSPGQSQSNSQSDTSSSSNGGSSRSANSVGIGGATTTTSMPNDQGSTSSSGSSSSSPPTTNANSPSTTSVGGVTTTTKPPSTTTTTIATTTTTKPPSTTTTTTTTTTSTTTTTTTTIPLPPAAPTALSGTGSCKAIVLIPQVALSWTPSVTVTVTGDQIFRSTNGTTYSAISTVSGRSSNSYNDTTVSGGTKYWYQISATAPSGSTKSAVATATTPGLCL